MKLQFGNPNINAGAVNMEIKGILNSGWVSIGEYVEALEDCFKTLCGVKYAIGCNSATTGLIIAIKAAGWDGLDVHLPAFTWPSTLYAVKCNGNDPIFHDINKDTWLMDYNFSKIYGDDCVIPVDVFGNQAEIPGDFEKSRIIIDAAHGFGLPNLGKRGIAEVVSLSFTKVVTGMEGGMILTDDDELAEIAIELRRLSGRMGEINALIAMNSIRDYDPSATQLAINRYKNRLEVPYRCQYVSTGTNNSVFSLRFESSAVRDAIRIALEKEGIETKVYYDPLQPGHPETERLYNTILSIPTHADTVAFQDSIIETINKAAMGAKTPGKGFLTQ